MEIDNATAQRFYKKVRVARGGCWEWCAATWSGYGRMKVLGRFVMAHRLSFEMHVRAIPEGMCVCHRCDNPRCVRPSHLFEGTHQDNINDAKRKGRLRFVQRTPKLSGIDLETLVQMVRDTGMRATAATLGCSHATVSKFLRHRCGVVERFARRLRTSRPKELVDRECANCGALFHVRGAEARRGNGVYCSRECSWKSKVGQPRQKVT